jgi:hypothetical protein
VLASSEVWVYELWSSRKRLPRASRVRDPWHKILYRQVADGIEILAGSEASISAAPNQH